ncbi:IclR family pca regulon transcriptional regulator [Nitrobacteraceae bacterium AZCC 2161]|jgi:IclR family pca regulon transcriptional regulator
MIVVANKAKTKKAAPADNPKNFVNSVGKAFAVLKSFTADDFELTISEIAARADLDRGTAFRLVQTLVKLGYVQAVDQTRHYRLGLKCLDLGYTALSAGNLRGKAEPLLRELVPVFGDAASLGVLDGSDVVYLARFSAGLDRHKIDRRPGSRIKAYAAALGHVMLAYLPKEEQVERLEASERVKLSERTLTELKDLLTRLEQVCKQGYAISDGENAYGLRTIAAPVFGAGNSVIAGISLTIDANRIDIKAFRTKALPEMLRVAKTLTDANRRGGLLL